MYNIIKIENVYKEYRLGAKNDLDAVFPAFVFSKEISDDNIIWSGRYWGYNRLPDMKVL